MTFSRTDPYWGDGFEVLAISEDSSACAQHERQRAGGVGHQRRGAEGEQGGEGEERATASQGVDRSGGCRGTGQSGNFQCRHHSGKV